MRTIRLDQNDNISFLNRVDYCVGTGRMGLALHKEYLDQLKLVQEEIGFSYIRGHGLFTDDMAIYQERPDGKVDYNYTYLDRVIDSYLELKIKPFLELGFMPEKMASGKQTVFYWKGNVTPPKDYKNWTDMVQSLLVHLSERYGREEVITWPIEVWNEPNLPGFWKDADMQEYFKLFHRTFDAIKEIDERFCVGGPAVCGGTDEIWISAFMKYCHENQIKVDFITRHHYNTELPEDVGHYGYPKLTDAEQGFANLKTTRDIIDAYEEYKGLEIHITEYNTSYIPNAPLHDTNQNAAYLARQLSRLGDGNASYSYWTFGDVFEERGVPFTLFHGGFGLVANGCIPKPTFYSFVFFKWLKEAETKKNAAKGTKKQGDNPAVCMHRDDKSIVLKYEDGSLRGVLWNDSLVERTGEEITFGLVFPQHSPGSLTMHIVDEDTCNPLKVWHDIGEPANPSAREVKLLKQAANPLIKSKRIIDTEGDICEKITVKENGVVYFEYRPGTINSDWGYCYERTMQYPDSNPLLPMDYPDPDIIRVADTYYMISTTMYFMPGCEILRSYDLKHWEHACFVYDKLDSTPAQRLEGDENIYGKGMWAATLRFHNDTFYVCFVANDTHKTYLYRTKNLYGNWEKSEIEGFYHDPSLLFDDDGRIYITYGNRDVYLLELKEDLSGPKQGGLHRLLVSDATNPMLGYEGSHFYKINGRYYLFLIHSREEKWRRTQCCFSAKSLTDDFVGGEVFNDDRGFRGSGIAQGGIVDTPDGSYYSVMFQDSGSVGRLPILVPVKLCEGQVIFGVDGRTVEKLALQTCAKPGYTYAPLYGNEDFKGPLHTYMQFNHEPDKSLYTIDSEKGVFRITTDKICKELTQAKNTLTQRMLYPGSAAEVIVDGEKLKDGDFAGLVALQGNYAFLGLTRVEGVLKLAYIEKHKQRFDPTRNEQDCADREAFSIEILDTELKSSSVRIRFCADFRTKDDWVTFTYKNRKKMDDGNYREDFFFAPFLQPHEVFFGLDHFTGLRAGMCVFSTKESGGGAEFSDFRMYRH